MGTWCRWVQNANPSNAPSFAFFIILFKLKVVAHHTCETASILKPKQRSPRGAICSELLR